MVGPSWPAVRRRAALVALAAALACACRGERIPTIEDLAGVDQLKARFNRDAGMPRTVLLVSPT